MDSKEEQLGEIEQEFKQEEEGGHDYEKDSDNFHVLAVDDSLIDRKILEKLLTLSSFHVTCVESGDKALEYLGLLDHLDHDHHSNIHPSRHDHHQELSWKKKGEGARVNLIMTDYSMPGITGYDLLKRVKGSSWKDVPVVVMSSENVPSRIHMCLEEGADEFLLKPVRLSDLKKLHPHLLKSTTSSTQCCGSNNRKRSYTKGLFRESGSDLEANDILYYDCKQQEIVIRELNSSFDKGKANIDDDDQHFDRGVKLEGLTASVNL